MTLFTFNKRLPLILITALAVPASATAQDEATPDADTVDLDGYELAENLKDRQVLNAVGQEIGELSNIIIRGDRVTHAIISIGGFIGLGGSEVVVPFDALVFEGDSVTIETIATADQIESLTTFEPNNFGLSD